MKIPKIFTVLYNEEYHTAKTGKTKGLNSRVNEVVQNCQSQNTICPQSLSEDDIVERAIFTMVNEASRCLQEKVV